MNRYLIGTIALLLAGCGSGASAVPQSASSAALPEVKHGKSWMLPEAKNEGLIYISRLYEDVSVYSYPDGNLVGTLGVEGAAYECSDKNGNVYVAETYADAPGVYEYAHGGTQPIKYLPVSEAFSCAVDPSTGNLAVISLRGHAVYVFQNATGTPTTYQDTSVYYFSGLSYDNSGNLFLSGAYYSSPYTLAELPNGSSTFLPITLNGRVYLSGFEPLFWDGQYLDIADRSYFSKVAVVDQLTIANGAANIVRSIPLKKERNGLYPQFYVAGSTLIQVLNTRVQNADLYFVSYPRGKIQKRIKLTNQPYQWGLTFSVAPSQ